MKAIVKQSSSIQTQNIPHFTYTDSPDEATIILGRCLKQANEILSEDILYFVSNIVNEFTQYTIFEVPGQQQNASYGYYEIDGALKQMSLGDFYSEYLQSGFAIRFTISNSISKEQKIGQLRIADAVLSFIKNISQIFSNKMEINSDDLYSQTKKWLIEQNIQK